MFVVPYLTFGLVRAGGGEKALSVVDASEEVNDSRPSNVIIGPNGQILHDKYGFYLTDSFQKMLGKSPEEVGQRNAKEQERTTKWLRMLKNWDFVCKYRKAKLKRRIRKGIPNIVRAWAWFHISGAQLYKDKYPDVSKLDVAGIPAKVKEDIEKDVDRTFPKHLQFADSDGHGQASLRRLLLWYAAIDSEVGYCQGMGFIAGLLLTYMEEQEAFYCFAAALLNPNPTPLRDIYLPDLGDAKRKLYVFGELGRQHLGALWIHLEDQKMHPTMYATEWLMTMFCRGFSFDLVTRVWDIYLVEGFKIVYRVALALLKVRPEHLIPLTQLNSRSDCVLSLHPPAFIQTVEPALLKAEFEDIMSIINAIPEAIDPEDIMALSWSLPLRRSDIVKHEKSYALQQGLRINF